MPNRRFSRRAAALPTLACLAWGACLAWALTGCVADPAAPPPSASKTGAPPGNPLMEPVQMQEYIPGGGAAARKGQSPANGPRPAQDATDAATQAQNNAATANQRRGSGTSPDLLTPPSVPAGPTTVKPKDSTADTARFKRDLLQPGVTEMQRKDGLGRLDPIQQRDLFNRQHELHRLETDPLRR